MMRGINAVAPGRPLNAIGRVIESYAKRFDYGVVRDFTGHGIGRTFHSGLVVPHFDDPATTVIPSMHVHNHMHGVGNELADCIARQREPRQHDQALQAPQRVVRAIGVYGGETS